ncbi:MAG: YggT family protein [Chloroflexi bacterium]|nr:YggT family protein [Chloroflexota bacterium]
MGPLDVAAFLIYFAEAFVEVLASTLSAVIIIRVILSWVPLQLPFGLGDLVFSISESVLGPIRRALPPMSGFDLSPLVALVGISLIERYVLLPLLNALFRAL